MRRKTHMRSWYEKRKIGINVNEKEGVAFGKHYDIQHKHTKKPAQKTIKIRRAIATQYQWTNNNENKSSANWTNNNIPKQENILNYQYDMGYRTHKSNRAINLLRYGIQKKLKNNILKLRKNHNKFIKEFLDHLIEGKWRWKIKSSLKNGKSERYG